MDCSPPGSFIHRVFQARVLEWVAMPFSRGSSWPRNWIRVSCIAGRFFTIWATREVLHQHWTTELPGTSLPIVLWSFSLLSETYLQGALISFSGKWNLGAMNCALDILIASEVWLFPGFSVDRIRKYVYNNVYMNWCFWTVVLEKTLESPLDCKEIQPVHPKGDQSWVFIGRTDAEAETPILWPPHAKSWLIGKDPDVGKDWRQEEKGMTEDGWMASPTQWAWVWVNSRSWWWTGRPGVLWFMGLQRVGHDWATELNWMCICICTLLLNPFISLYICIYTWSWVPRTVFKSTGFNLIFSRSIFVVPFSDSENVGVHFHWCIYIFNLLPCMS